MFNKSIKTVLAAAVIATGGAFAATTANAGTSFGIYIGNGYGHSHAPSGGIYFNNGGYNHGYVAPRGHRKCNPRRALNKAYRMGVYNPHVTRVNHRKIVVKGYSHGHNAKVVFKRNSKRCKVLKTRGIY